MFHVTEGFCGHPEQGIPERSLLSGISQAQIVRDLRGMADAMKSELLTPTLAQGQCVSSVCHATDLREPQ